MQARFFLKPSEQSAFYAPPVSNLKTAEAIGLTRFRRAARGAGVRGAGQVRFPAGPHSRRGGRAALFLEEADNDQEDDGANDGVDDRRQNAPDQNEPDDRQ